MTNPSTVVRLPQTRRPGVVACCLLAALATLVVVGAQLASMPAGELVGSYAVTNFAFGAGFGACGAVLVVQRPDHRIGWLFVLGSAAHLATAAAVPWIVYGGRHAWPVPLLRAMSTVALGAWPAGILLCFPAALLVFPTGRLRSRAWRLAYIPLALGALSEVGVLSPEPVDAATHVSSLLVWPALSERLAPVMAVLQVGSGVTLVLALAQLLVRARTGGEVERRQISWLALAVLAATALNLHRFATGDGPILLLLAFELIPVAITVAVVRHQLFDIQLMVSRTVVFALLTSGVVAVYLGTVALLAPAMSRPAGGVGAALAVALLANPGRVWLQRRVDRLLYGDPGDAARALSGVADPPAYDLDLDALAGSLAGALRLPYLEIRHGNRVVSSGSRPVRTTTLDVPGGQLVAGLRHGQGRLSSADRRALGVVAGPMLLALQRSELAEQLAASRRALVGAHEQERARIQRDLHDGLGPTLTGVAFTVDAVRNGVGPAPADVLEMLDELRADVTRSIAEVRRLVNDLRPLSMEEAGLDGALRSLAARLERDGVVIDLAVEAPEVHEEVALVAYRIACEAMTNAARHAGATRIEVRLRADDTSLEVVVADDGASAVWGPAGTGVTSMALRASMVGGTCTAGPTGHGGLVRARLPVAGPVPQDERSTRAGTGDASRRWQRAVDTSVARSS